MPNVLIPLAQGGEELEAVTVIDLLRRAGFEVTVAGLTNGPVRGSRGTVLLPDTTLEQVMQKKFDMVVLPGGQPGTNNLNADPRIHALLRDMAETGKYIAAICAAPKILANAGLLKGRRATSFPGSLDAAQLTGVDYVEETVVRDGKFITSRGPGTAMDFALTLIELLADKHKRDEVEATLMRPR